MLLFNLLRYNVITFIVFYASSYYNIWEREEWYNVSIKTETDLW